MRILVTGGSGFIGVNLIDALVERSFTVSNLDISEPLNPLHAKYWTQGSVLDADTVNKVLEDSEPQLVVHLAARTELGAGSNEHGFEVNDVGTEILLRQLDATSHVDRVIVASTMLVSKLGRMPRSDTDYSPETVYGESKAGAEMVTRRLDIEPTWSIIRPTTVWGPWNVRLRDELLVRISRGRYVHPSGVSAVRSYGYVGNVVHQILALLDAPQDIVHRETFYVGDPAIELYDYVNAFSIALRGSSVRRVPGGVFKVAARLGDLLSDAGIEQFPLSSYRLANMTEDNVLDVSRITDIAGPGPFTLAEGVDMTLAWARL